MTNGRSKQFSLPWRPFGITVELELQPGHSLLEPQVSIHALKSLGRKYSLYLTLSGIMSGDELSGIDYVLTMESRDNIHCLSGGISLTGTQLSTFAEMCLKHLSSLRGQSETDRRAGDSTSESDSEESRGKGLVEEGEGETDPPKAEEITAEVSGEERPTLPAHLEQIGSHPDARDVEETFSRSIFNE